MQNRPEAVDPLVLTIMEQAASVLSPAAAFRCQTSVSEALYNLVLHAETSDKSAPIDIEVAINGAGLTIEIFDPVGAKPFDIREQATVLSDIDPMAESGRGLGLILECADRVDYGLANDRNRLSLSFSA